MKTQFDLVDSDESNNVGSILIVGKRPINLPYVPIKLYDKAGNHKNGFIKDRDLERFAVNILKALKSRHLKSLK